MDKKTTKSSDNLINKYIYDDKQAEVVSIEPANEKIVSNKKDLLKQIIYMAIISLQIPGFLVSCSGTKEQFEQFTENKIFEKTFGTEDLSDMLSLQAVCEDLKLSFGNYGEKNTELQNTTGRRR